MHRIRMENWTLFPAGYSLAAHADHMTSGIWTLHWNLSLSKNLNGLWTPPSSCSSCGTTFLFGNQAKTDSSGRDHILYFHQNVDRGEPSGTYVAGVTWIATAILSLLTQINILATDVSLAGAALSAIATGYNTVTVSCNSGTGFTLFAAAPRMITIFGGSTYTLNDPLKMSSLSTGPLTSLESGRILADET